MTTDILICHPRDILYPLWMWRTNRDRHLFGRIVIIMTQSSSDGDYTEYIKQTVKDATAVTNYPYAGIDWRNEALQEGLYETRGERVLFLEQDFLVVDGFFEQLLAIPNAYDAIGFCEGERFHPACLLVNQEAIAKTRRDFSVDADIGDHFSKFTADIKKLNRFANLADFPLPAWKHLAGLTQNFRLTKNFYQAVDFYTYLTYCEYIPQPNQWLDFCSVVREHVLHAGLLDGLAQSFIDMEIYFKEML